MSSIEYKDSSGLSIAFHFSAELLKFNFSENIWFSIGRLLLKAVDKLFLDPVKGFVVHVMEFRDALIIEGEKSRARIQTGKLIEVTKVYEQAKCEVENLAGLSGEAKQKLIIRLDRMLDLHMDQIIEYGP
jgi:hypothetical protein